MKRFLCILVCSLGWGCDDGNSGESGTIILDDGGPSTDESSGAVAMGDGGDVTEAGGPAETEDGVDGSDESDSMGPMDECATDNGGCGNPQFITCADTPSGPPVCTDIDECATDNGGCGDA